MFEYLSREAIEKVNVLENTLNGSILIYSRNLKKQEEQNNKVSVSRGLWETEPEVRRKDDKENSLAILAQIIMVADDAPEYYKNLIGRTVMVNGMVGKTYWLSSNKVEELTWIDPTAIFALVKE